MGDRHELLINAMKDLTERERDIIEARRLRDEPATLEELSQKYGVSRERVRQIRSPRLREASARHEVGDEPRRPARAGIAALLFPRLS